MSFVKKNKKSEEVKIWLKLSYTEQMKLKKICFKHNLIGKKKAIKHILRHWEDVK